MKFYLESANCKVICGFSTAGTGVGAASVWVPLIPMSYGRKWRGAKKPLDESEGGEWKSWLKAQHSEN